MGALDIVILFAYLALMVGLGFYAKRREKNVDDSSSGRPHGPVHDRLHVARGLDRRRCHG